jgi:hypothetical protein
VSRTGGASPTPTTWPRPSLPPATSTLMHAEIAEPPTRHDED